MHDTPLLVVGASGILGHKIVELLYKGGATKIIAASKGIDGLTHFKRCGIRVHCINLDEPATLDIAFAGSYAMPVSTGTPLDWLGSW